MPDNFATTAEFKRLDATQMRKSSIVFLSSSVNVNNLLDVRGTTGVPTAPSKVSAANPLLLIPCNCPLNSLI